MISTLWFFLLAALGEIVGSFAFWAVVRLEKSPLWLVPGVISLAFFAYMLTRIDVAFAGRAFAAYGGVYIASSLMWLWIAEGQRPDRWDVTGGAISLVGAAVILLAPRAG